MPLEPGQGQDVSSSPGKRVELLHASPELTITWSQYTPGEPGPDPHIHREHTDSFFVLTGELAYRVGPDLEPLILRAGEWLSVPPNVIHTFANTSDQPATFLNYHSPDGGFAAYMRGEQPGFDSFDPPEGGGLPAERATYLASPPARSSEHSGELPA
jgi:quercetin dioxygenase-like cupin family protein